MHEALQKFHPVIGRWFEEKVGIPTPPQVLGWPVIGAGKSCLILAPTGSGKTLAAFLAAIDWLARKQMDEPANGRRGRADETAKRITRGKIADSPIRPFADSTPWGVQILYVSPLKSLANDVRKNLVGPLREIADVAAEMGAEWPEISVGVRTGDTPQRERVAMAKRPPHILITTPESLNLMLTSGRRSMFASVQFLIVDEVHALAGSKRGVFLSLVLERLEEERREGKTEDQRRKTKGETGRVKIAPGVYVAGEPYAPMVRVGLSATARPEELIAQWLGGADDEGKWRPVEIVRSGQRKRLDLGVVCPFGGEEEVMSGRLDERANRRGVAVADSPIRPLAESNRPRGTGHWPEVTRAILRMIREHHSTLVFGNSRRLIERLAARFEEELETEAQASSQKPEAGCQTVRIPAIRPHHGSIAKEVRLETEQALKRGELDAVLATSSLELGIDIGALDLVVQIDSPGNVAAGLQRVGRAGHLEKATAKGRLLARGLGELASLAALVPLMFEGTVEETRVPLNCLDVLAQQIVAACAGRPWKRGDLYRILRRALPYTSLTEKQFDSVVAMLSKRAERVTSQGLRPRLSFDRVNDELIIMPGAEKVLMMNSGVISDTGAFPVFLVGGKKGKVEVGGKDERRGTKDEKFGGVRIGELDEEFVYETKEGDRIVLGSQTWRVVRIDADRVLVEHASPGSSRMPFWRGEQAPRSEMLGEAVGRFYGDVERRLSEEQSSVCHAQGRAPEHARRKNQTHSERTTAAHPADSPGNMLGRPSPSMAHDPRMTHGNDDAVRAWLVKDHHFDEQSAENALAFYRRQMARSALPTHQRIVIEHFVDRTGEPIIAILCPLGSRINYTLRLALEGQFARRKLPAQLVHSDDGIIIRPPAGEVPTNPLSWLRTATLEQEIIDALEGTSLFGLRFRQNAARALMLPRMTVTQRTPLWQQRLRGRHLLALVKKQRNFPIIVETYRECLQDVLGIRQARDLLGRIERGDVATEIVRNAEPSAFAMSLFSQFQASYLYAWDDPLLTAETEPAIDQVVLDDILRRRGDPHKETGEAARKEQAAWEAADEAALLRRIMGTDYPARSPEELLEKIEAAGAVGVGFGLAGDPRWDPWVVGGAEEARRMLMDLSQRRRLFLVASNESPDAANPKSAGGDYRWVAADYLGLLIAARGKRPLLRRFTEQGTQPSAWDDLPAAILASNLNRDDARRTMVEQAIKQRPVTTAGELETDLPWILREIGPITAELTREGLAQALANGRIVWTEYAEQLRSLALRRERRAASTVDVAALQCHLLRWQHLESPREGADALEDVLDMFAGVSLPLEFWELEALPARVKDFSPTMLDAVCAAGHRVWVGAGGADSPTGIGTVSFWPRHLLGERKPTAPPEISADGRRLIEFLQKHGASFLLDMQFALDLDDGDMAQALESLAFAGKISNDQLEGLREVVRLAENARRDRALHPGRTHAAGRYPAGVGAMKGQRRLPGGWWKARSGISAGAGHGLGGRWFLLPEMPAPNSAVALTERAADRVERLLRRTAFACRELIDPKLDGSWRDCYDILTRMEWAGSVRRGYFVDGIGGSQFARPGIRLEMNADAAVQNAQGSGVIWLSMLDPANVWAQVDARWVSDSGEPARVARAPGNWIALVEGQPVLAAVNWAHRLIPLAGSDRELQNRALETLHLLLPRLPRLHRPHLDVRQWDQQDIVGSPADEILRAQGFTRDTQGLRLYRQYVPAN